MTPKAEELFCHSLKNGVGWALLIAILLIVSLLIALLKIDRYFDDCYFADQFFDSQSVSNLVSAAALALLCLQWFLAAVQVCHTLPGLAPSCWSCLCVQSVCLALAATKVSSCLRGFLWPYSHCLECISFICCSTIFFCSSAY